MGRYKTIVQDEQHHEAFFDNVSFGVYPNRIGAVMAIAEHAISRAEAAEARAAQLEQERDGYKDAYARFADEIIELQAQLSRLTLERDNALAERDRANAGFAALKNEYDKAMTRLSKLGEKVTA